jgi:hypothetical protein
LGLQAVKETASTESTKKLPMYVMKCNPSYLSSGLIYTGEESALVRRCVICNKPLNKTFPFYAPFSDHAW